MTCKINGTTFTASSFYNTMIGGSTAKRLDVRGTDASGDQLIITINDVTSINSTFSHLNDTVFVDNFENSPFTIMSIGTFISGSSTYQSMGIGEGKSKGYVIITSLDISNKTASGKFEFVLENSSEQTMNVTEGVFSNVSYTQTSI